MDWNNALGFMTNKRTGQRILITDTDPDLRMVSYRLWPQCRIQNNPSTYTVSWALADQLLVQTEDDIAEGQPSGSTAVWALATVAMVLLILIIALSGGCS